MSRTVRTPLCDLLGIEHPVVGFTPSEHVAAAISRAGGLGVLGCVRFNDPAELDAVLDWMDGNTGGRPYGVDVVMPATVPTEGAPVDLGALIQLRPGAAAGAAALQAHVRGLLAGYKVPRTVWFVAAVGRTVSGKADYRWARQYIAEHPPATPASAERAP